MAGSVPQLDEPTALSLLRGYGLAGPEGPVTVRTIAGGVSSTVLLAESPSRRLVLKQPRLRFEVGDE